jgi:ribose transport system substrate-binding protein
MHSKSAAAISAVVALLALAACGNSSDASSGSDSGGSPADVTAAEDAIAAYVEQPSKFPVTTPLEKKSTGKKIAYLDCGTPICALFGQLAAAPFEALGMTMTTVKAGLKPDTVQSAFDTVVQGGYDGVFVPAIPPQLWENGLQQLKDADIPVVTSGVVGADPYVQVQQAGEAGSANSGKLMADWVVAKHGDNANVVLYWTPELPFEAVVKDAFTKEMDAVCPRCEVRTEEISVTTFGTTAGSTIVADLQAHPDTKVAVFGIGEQTAGLPAQLKTAGLDIESVVNSPDPSNLADIKAGNLDVGLGLDLPVLIWTVADSLARQTTGQAPDPGAVADIAPQQFLTADDLQYDVSQGWTGYPDFADRFNKLWSQAK